MLRWNLFELVIWLVKWLLSLMGNGVRFSFLLCKEAAQSYNREWGRIREGQVFLYLLVLNLSEKTDQCPIANVFVKLSVMLLAVLQELMFRAAEEMYYVLWPVKGSGITAFSGKVHRTLNSIWSTSSEQTLT